MLAIPLTCRDQRLWKTRSVNVADAPIPKAGPLSTTTSDQTLKFPVQRLIFETD
jgi:hypothetical protein